MSSYGLLLPLSSVFTLLFQRYQGEQGTSIISARGKIHKKEDRFVIFIEVKVNDEIMKTNTADVEMEILDHYSKTFEDALEFIYQNGQDLVETILRRINVSTVEFKKKAPHGYESLH